MSLFNTGTIGASQSVHKLYSALFLYMLKFLFDLLPESIGKRTSSEILVASICIEPSQCTNLYERQQDPYQMLHGGTGLGTLHMILVQVHQY